jgi:hypothetical protein
MSHHAPEEISIAERATTVGPITGISSSSSWCREARLSSTAVIIRFAAA